MELFLSFTTWLGRNNVEIDSLNKLAASLAITIGGIWVIYQFIIKRGFASQVEFSVDMNFIGLYADHWIVEIIAIVNNKGGSHLKIHEFPYSVRLLSGECLKLGDEKINFQTVFQKEIKSGSWFPRHWKNTMLEPNTVVRYSKAFHIPTSAAFLLLHGRIHYRVGFIIKTHMFHTADRVIRVPIVSP